MLRTARCLFPRKFSGQRGVPATHLPDGEGLGGSLPDSIIVGRTGPIPSRVVLRDFVEPDELLCSTGICLFTGLAVSATRSEEHTSELQSPMYLVCRLLLEKKNS